MFWQFTVKVKPFTLEECAFIRLGLLLVKCGPITLTNGGMNPVQRLLRIPLGPECLAVLQRRQLEDLPLVAAFNIQ